MRHVVVLAAVLLASAPLAALAPAGPVEDLPEESGLRFPWLTPGIAERLRDGESVPFSDIDGFPRSAHEDAPIPYTRIRPGSPLGLSQLACTANFVFRNATSIGIGTAGHCTHEGEKKFVLLADPESQSIGVLRFGQTIFSTGNGGVGNDFALIEVDPAYRDLVHPAIAEIDGPCGFRATTGLGDPIQFYGHGLGFGAGGQPRTGTIVDHHHHWVVYARLPGGSPGDSGSPVRFLAEGTETGYAAAAINTHGLAQIGQGTTTPRIMNLLDGAGMGDWELVDSPNCGTLP